MTNPVDEQLLSIIVPVGRRHGDIARLHADYKLGVEATGRRHEFVFVLDGPLADVAAALAVLQQSGENITVVSMSREFGEATALMAGFEQCSGQTILTLPAYSQIDATDIVKLVAAMDRCDMAVGHRWPRAGGWLESLRRRAFHGLVASVTGLKLRDLGCGARAMTRRVLEEISVYGDQHRFLPVLADRQGFRVLEIDVAQSPADRFEGVYPPRDYAHRVLDIFTVFFLVRFTKKPLRFFGMLGASLFGLGSLLVFYLVIQRLFFGQALADRPALLLSSLLLVVGLQLFALGLLGEIIIFTHARNIKDYQIDRVIRFDRDT
jgi:glycosyltransferase involved in cell wall biosynthesis